jgi:hypothetical protein
MNDASCHNVFHTAGLRRIGSIHAELTFDIWWQDAVHLEVMALHLDQEVLLRGSKYYRLIAQGMDGELYSRDLAALETEVTSSFPEAHFLLSSFGDITRSQAQNRILEKRFRHLHSADQVTSQQLRQRQEILAAEIAQLEQQIRQDEKRVSLVREGSSLMATYLKNRLTQSRQRWGRLQG